MNIHETGHYGERCAAEYLKSHGYTVTAMNRHCSHNEIDIIAEDENFVVFVEVKTRSRLPGLRGNFGRPAASVNYAKRQRTLAAARAYLRENPTKKQPRIDVMEVYISPDDPEKVLDIVHIRNSFGG